MSHRSEMRLLSIATLLAGGTGLILHVMKDWMEPVDPFSVINHPWQPWVLKAHLLAVPFMIFAVGLVFSSHAARRYRNGVREGRGSGLGLLVLFAPLVLSGVAIQILTGEGSRRAMVWLHLGTGLGYLAFFVGHRLATRLRARVAGGRGYALERGGPTG
jgi:hypothetical protein